MQPSQQRIQDASKGLFYMSEGDYPFEVFCLNYSSSSLVDKLLELSSKEKGTKVDVLTLEQFLRNMTTLPPNSGPDQKHSAERFLNLQHVLKAELTDIAVYLVGEVVIDARKVMREFIRTGLINTFRPFCRCAF